MRDRGRIREGGKREVVKRRKQKEGTEHFQIETMYVYV